jgi:hypothetical protein
LKARKVKGLEARATYRESAGRIVGIRLEELTGLAERALSPSEAEAQHDLRIAAKRLRYVLEVAGPCLGPEAEDARRGAKRLQEVIGEIHDCDVMLPRVEALLEEVRTEDARAALARAGGADDLDPAALREVPNRGAYTGLNLLAVHLRARRALLFERFRERWRAEAASGTWESLAAVLRGG